MYKPEPVFEPGFVWANIPELAILTGVNGAGKTQLLNLVQRGLLDSSNSTIRIDGVQLPDKPGGHSYTVHSAPPRPQVVFYGSEWPNIIGSGGAPSTNPSGTQGIWESEGAFGAWMVSIFTDYFNASAQALIDEEERSATRERLGTPPWEVVNETLAVLDVPFRINQPTRVGDAFVPVLRSTRNWRDLPIEALSSGERIFVTLALLIFANQAGQQFPYVLLLDEPDAHLHPSHVRQLLQVIQQVFVLTHRIRVIMTTHSPSTVALAPAESLFLLTAPEATSSGVHEIRAVSTAEAVGRLTEGVLTVARSIRYVFVEGRSDVPFYEGLWNRMTFAEPGGPPVLTAEPALVFKPVAGAKAGGGKHDVRSMVDLLRGFGLADSYHGIIDRDAGNPGGDGIHVLGRYSIENYLYDPICVYAALHSIGMAPEIPGISLRPGGHADVGKHPSDKLQAIVDTITGELAPSLTLTPEDHQRVEVRFVSGQTVEYPRWTLVQRGKDLCGRYQHLFPGTHSFGSKFAGQIFAEVNLISSDLLDLFRAIQAEQVSVLDAPSGLNRQNRASGSLLA